MPWGANQFATKQQFLACQSGADVVCAAGSWTTAMSINGANSTIVTTETDNFIPSLTAMMFFKLGATPPTALFIGFALVSGTEIDSIAVTTDLLTASNQFAITVPLLGAASKSTWQSAQSPLVEVNPTGQSVTVRAVGGSGSRAIFQLLLGGP